ncbi:MAG: immunity 17 family protein, partial [Pirellulales bacterium]
VQGLILGLILAAAGIFSICGAAFNWDWFIESHKARFFVATFGRTGARIFYAILGIVIVVIGVLMALGLVSSERKRKRFGLPHSRLEQRLENHGDRGLVALPAGSLNADGADRLATSGRTKLGA